MFKSIKLNYCAVCLLLATGFYLSADVRAAEIKSDETAASQNATVVESKENSAEHKLITQYLETQQFDKALPIIKKCAEAGDAVAQEILAQFYFKGIATERDIDKALVWLNKAAEQGYNEAEYELGQIYDLNEIVPRNPKTAMYWLERSAAHGHAVAQFVAGMHCINGDGV